MVALQEIRRLVEEKGGDDAETRRIKNAYNALDQLVSGLYDLKAHLRKLEKRLLEFEATACTKHEAFRAELERQGRIHQQVIAERDLAQELLLKRDEEVVAAEEKATRLAQNTEQFEPARTALAMKDMEILAYRKQEQELRDQLQEVTETQAAVEAKITSTRDEAHAAFREKEAPRTEKRLSPNSGRKNCLPPLPRRKIFMMQTTRSAR